MMEIKVNNDKVEIDGNEMATADLTKDVLDEVVFKSLLGDVTYDISGEHPLAMFFKTLQDETQEGSSLHQKMQDMKASREAAEASLPEEDAADKGDLLEHDSDELEGSSKQ